MLSYSDFTFWRWCFENGDTVFVAYDGWIIDVFIDRHKELDKFGWLQVNINSLFFGVRSKDVEAICKEVKQTQTFGDLYDFIRATGSDPMVYIASRYNVFKEMSSRSNFAPEFILALQSAGREIK